MAGDGELDEWLEHIKSLQRMSRGQCSEVPTRIAEWLYLGGHLGSDDSWQRWFQADGRAVTHIVNCAAGEVRYPIPEHVSVLNLNAKDDATYALFAHWPEVLAFVRSAPVVLFHCQAGVNRSASLALAAYAVRESKTLLASVRDMMAERPGILKNWHFNRSLVKCLRDEGLLGSAADVEVLRHEVAAYEQQVHVVFGLISQDGYADWALFRQALRGVSEEIGSAAEGLWERMAMYSDRPPMPGKSVPRNEASVELWFRMDPEAQRLFPRLLAMASDAKERP